MTTIDLMRDVVSWFFLVSGGFFCLVGGFGLIKFDSFYQRIHAAGVTDSLGAALIVGGLLFQADHWMIAAKLILLVVFLWVTGPTSSHALVKAAYALGLKAEIALPEEARHPDAPEEPCGDDPGRPEALAGVRYGGRPQ